MRSSFVVWGLYKICVGTEGQVTGIDVIRKVADDAALDLAWRLTMQSWRYQPLMENGQPKPTCHAERPEAKVL